MVVQTFLNCTEIHYKGDKFRFIFSLRDSKLDRYIRKFVIYIRIQNFAQIS